jgi:hypothetical protein
MSNQHQSETRTPGKGAGQKAGQDSRQKRDAHTNSSSAGKDHEADDIRGQRSSTRNLETEPDRAPHGERTDESSRVGK